MSAGDHLNLLIVEDNEDDYVIVRDLLRDIDPKKFTLEWAKSYEEGLKSVQEDRHDLILLDFRLSYHTGLELLQETQSVSSRAPVIFMTGQGDYEIDVQAMQSGAADYLVKDRLDADTLERAIRYAVERQKYVQSLRVSDERYRAFVKNSTEGIWRFELHPPLSTAWPRNEQIAHLCRFARIAECNDAAARLYGFERGADILGASLSDFLSPSASGYGACLSDFIDSRYQAMSYDAFNTDCPERPPYISHTLTGVVENNFLHRVWGTLTDITERKQAEEELRKSQARLKLALESANLGTFHIDMTTGHIDMTTGHIDMTTGSYHDLSATLKRQLGFGPEDEISQADVVQIRHPEDRDRMAEDIQMSLKNHQDLHAEYRYFWPDGSIHWIASNGRPVYSADGRPIGLIGVTQDITERKQAEETQMRLAAIVNASDEAIIGKTLDGIVTNWNPGAEAMFGYSAVEAVGQSILMLFPPECVADEEELLTRVRRGESVKHFDTVRIRKNRERIDVSVTLSPIADGYGRIIGVSKIARDITDQKRVETELAISAAKNTRIAETLQQSMLEASPAGKFPGVAVERFYAAAMNEANVGGDFYDSFALNEEQVALVVGDVTGKGLVAAARTAEIKYALRAFLHEYPDPEHALTWLNNFICETHRLDKGNVDVFIVLAVAIIDTATGATVFSAAGAEPTLILRADGTVEPVAITGMPLGIHCDAEYTAETRVLAVGETVLMATDGITEARCGHAFLGSTGLAQLAEKAGTNASLPELSQTIYTGALRFAGGALHDDVCLLLARRQRWAEDCAPLSE